MNLEWLEPDGRGGFASGTVSGVRTRRYHALLLPATQPPVARMVLVNGLEAWLQTPLGRFPLSTQCYTGSAGDVLCPDGHDFIADFASQPWPRWTYEFPDGTRIVQEFFVHRATGLTVLSWTLPEPQPVQLEVRLLMSGRDYHALHRENPAFDAAPVSQAGGNVLWKPYSCVPGVRAWSNATYRHDPDWYRHFVYSAERDRGLDFVEDLATPGVLTFDLASQPFAALFLGSDCGNGFALAPDADSAALLGAYRAGEQDRRDAFPDLLGRSGDAYLVRGLRGPTIIAGYPWFTDWGRDTFISLRGLCVATGRLDEARDILLQWSGAESGGMLPNRFPDSGEEAEYNTVDAALWFIIAAHEYLEARRQEGVCDPSGGESAQLLGTCQAILEGYTAGARYGIRLDEADGLIAAGEPGVALTWMDARVDGRAITPRIGKPVEIQALWINALALSAHSSPLWQALCDQARASFKNKFWNPDLGCLYDVIDCDGDQGRNDPSLRPNQIFAVGGLPLTLLGRQQARAVVDLVEHQLLTPLGLRTLARDEPGYIARYEGAPAQRDAAYHEGTVWPWLLGPFVEAWMRVRDGTAQSREEARVRFLDPLLALLPNSSGLNHLPEIADGDAPHLPKGCPFQAWSLGELTRAKKMTNGKKMTNDE